MKLMLTVRVRNGDKKYDKVINDEGSIIVGNIFASEKGSATSGRGDVEGNIPKS